MKKTLNLMLLIISMTFCLFAHAQNKISPVKPPAPKAAYASVSGLKMYYEIYGKGQPLLLLHGSFMTSNTNYGMPIPEISKNRKVIAVEIQGLGHTADINRPFSFETLEDDLVVLLKQLKLGVDNLMETLQHKSLYIIRI